MKIFIVSQTYDLKTNGQGVFVVHLAEGLAQAGEKVWVAMPSPTGGPFKEERNGVLVYGIRARSLAPFYPEVFVTPFPGSQMRRILDQFQPDLVHIQDHYPLSSSATGQAVGRGLPVIGTNNFLPENIIDNVRLFSLFPGLSRRILWRSVLRVYNRLNLATAATETAANILREAGIQIPVVTISCGVDLKRFETNLEPDRDLIRQSFGLSPCGVLFLYVGRLDKEKRLDLLIHALSLTGREDIEVAIAGHGAEKGHLQSLAGQLGVKDQVKFLDFVPGSKLPALLHSCDFFVMPSEAELQSIATLEALASGRPVLAARARALPELVEHGHNGYLFRTDDAEDAAQGMLWLSERLDQFEAMSSASLAIAKSHDLPNTIQRFIALYHSLV